MILIIDDEEIIRKMIVEMLGVEYEVRTAASNEEAFIKIAEAKKKGDYFRIVIVDLTKTSETDSEGQKFLKIIREKILPMNVIVTSGNTGDPVMKDPVKYGFDGALKKPFKISELKNLIDSNYSKKKLNCWEIKRCKEKNKCPAFTSIEFNKINHGHNGGRFCWGVDKTYCCGVEIKMVDKFYNCLSCPVLVVINEEEGGSFCLTPYQAKMSKEQLGLNS